MALILHGMKLAEKRYRCTFDEAKKAVHFNGRRATVMVQCSGKSMYVGRSVGLRREEDEMYLLIDNKGREEDVLNLFHTLGQKPDHRLAVPDKSTLGLRSYTNQAGMPMYAFIINFPRKLK